MLDKHSQLVLDLLLFSVRMCMLCTNVVCVLLCVVVLIIRGEGAERGWTLRIAYFGIAYFGIAYFEIAYFGIAYFGSKESNCLLCGRLASFE
jgi:hypothetical protein